MISQRKQTDDDSRKIQRDVLVMLVYGVGIWRLATSAIVAAGPLLLPKTGSRAGIGVIVLLALGALVVSRLAYGLYRHGREDALVDRLLFSTVVAISGLLLDALIYAFAIGRYPVLSSNQQGPWHFSLSHPTARCFLHRIFRLTVRAKEVWLPMRPTAACRLYESTTPNSMT